MNTGLQRAPSPACPILGGLEELYKRAQAGDMEAVRSIRNVYDACRKIVEKLPPKITKKRSSPEIPTNALALRLHEWVAVMREYSRGGDVLLQEIRLLEPLSKDTFPAWWRCAWALTEDPTFGDEKISALIDQICSRAPAVRAKLERRKQEAMTAANVPMAPGVGLRNSPSIHRKVMKPLEVGLREMLRYVRRQTRKAALRVWPMK